MNPTNQTWWNRYAFLNSGKESHPLEGEAEEVEGREGRGQVQALTLKDGLIQQ
ncbi:MAG: hypothetical protein PVJ38_01115 [Candidatus Bathyarchaeota archaeon]|jgi:hypothetical protein